MDVDLERQAVLGNLPLVDAEQALFAKCICICAGQSIKKEEVESLYA